MCLTQPVTPLFLINRYPFLIYLDDFWPAEVTDKGRSRTGQTLYRCGDDNRATGNDSNGKVQQQVRSVVVRDVQTAGRESDDDTDASSRLSLLSESSLKGDNSIARSLPSSSSSSRLDKVDRYKSMMLGVYKIPDRCFNSLFPSDNK